MSTELTFRARLIYCLTAVASASVLALSVASVASASGNVYRSQVNGSQTAAKFISPVALAVGGGGDMYVVGGEGSDYVVDELNLPGTGALLEEFTLKNEAGESFSPYGIAINSSGDLFVTDYEQGAVVEFNASGERIAQISGTETAAKSFSPAAVAVNSSGDLYVADAAHHVVDELPPSGTGSPIKEFTGADTAAKSFTPEGLAVDASNDIYVIDNEHSTVDEFNSTGTLERELTGGNTPQGSFSSFIPALAVAPSGEVYIPNGEYGVVDRFSATGAYLSQFNGEATPQESFRYVTLAVGASEEVYVGTYEGHGYVDIFGPPETGTAPDTQWVKQGATSVGETTATLNGAVDPEGGPVATCEFEYGTTKSYGQFIPCEQTPSQIGEGTGPIPASAEISHLAPDTKYYFRIGGDGVKGIGHSAEEMFTTQAAPAPTVGITEVTEVSGRSAIFNGDVNPNGFETTYRFEDSSDGVHWSVVGEGNAGSSAGKITVSQTARDLLGSTTYDVRLEAENVGGSSTSGEEAFMTPATPPQIFGAGVTVISGNEATLYATIYPEKQATTYRFEYGTTTAYGSSVPMGEDSLGSAPIQVSQMLQGLASATTYHFRVVATNGTNTTDGVDETFTTIREAEVVTEGACPNEALRAEGDIDPQMGTPYSMQLPDCRAYEQVTPPFKSFNMVVPGGHLLATASTEAISSSGSSLLEESTPLLGVVDADEELTGAYYELGRSASGWRSASLTAAASTFPISHEELASPTDVAEGLWSAATPSQSIHGENFYRRDADGNFLSIGPIAPLSATMGPPHGARSTTAGPQASEAGIVGASADLTNVVFQLDSPGLKSEKSYLWPGDSTVPEGPDGNQPSMYEYAGVGHTGEVSDVPALVGVDNSAAQISDCGTGLGADVGRVPQRVHNGVSVGGSTIFFTAQAGGCVTGASGPTVNQVYARVGTPGSAQATVNVAGSSGCVASTACEVTSSVAYQGASSDGSKVFFTTSQALLPSDRDTTNDIYECALPGDDGATPIPTGLVNACPDLKAVSVTGTNSGANVQRVLAVSEEGSRVYFTATGVLTNAANLSLPSGHQVAQEGEDNLYVWEAASTSDPAGHTAFIATLPGSHPDEAQATPDGRHLVFTTTADLTGDDTSTAAQAFRYDARTGELVRVSIGQEGFNSDGNTSSDPATLASTSLGRLTISENGSYVVFQSSDALTPQVHGGTNNVYEWHDGNVYLISDGTDSQSNAGLIGMDATGENVFFVTADKLVGQDTDEDYDVYDARIDGGFPAPTPEASCSGEACQGPLTGSLVSSTPLITSNGTPAIGNLPAASAKHASTGARRVSIAKHTVRGPAITLFVSAGGNGLISVSGAGVRELRRFVSKAAVYAVRPTLTGRERRLLRRRRRLRLELTVSFRSASGATSSAKVAVTVRA